MRKMLFLRLVVISFAVFGYQQTSFVHATDNTARTYYVSQSSGNDTNTGLSPQTAWKTVAKVNSSTFQSGDQILFKRGDSWRELLKISWSGLPDKPIVIGAYGNGDLPKFKTSVSWNDPSAWKKLRNNIWQATYTETTGSEIITNPSFNSNTDGWNLYVNKNVGASATMSRTITAGEYHSSAGGAKIAVTNNGSETSDLQFKTDFTIENDSYYLLSFWAKSTSAFRVGYINLNKNSTPYTTYTSLPSPTPTIGTDWAQYNLLFRTNTAATDARLTFFLGGSIPDGAAFYIDDLSFKKYTPTQDLLPYVDVGNISFNNGASYGHKKMTPSAELTSQGDFFYDANLSTVDLYSTSNPANAYSSIEFGLKLTTIDILAQSYVTIKNLYLLNSAMVGIYVRSDSHHIEISDNEISNIGGSRFGYSGSREGNGIELWANVHDIIVERNKFWEIYDAAIGNEGYSGSQYNLYYRNNIIWNTALGITSWLNNAAGALYNVYIEHNTIGFGGGQSSSADRPDGNWGGLLFLSHTLSGNVHDVYIRNNIFYKSTFKLLTFGAPWLSVDNLVIANNLFWQANPTDIAIAWGYKASFDDHNITLANLISSWQVDNKAIAQNNMVGDPVFVDAVNHNYALQVTSPAINAGISIDGITSDYLQNKYFGLPDIGAYEYTTAGEITAPIAMPTPTDNPNCKCNALKNCTTACTFEGVSGTADVKCELSSSLFQNTPADTDKTDWCQRPKRTIGDANGDYAITNLDYMYYISAVNGGKIPVTVNPDFNGDGEVGAADRTIIIGSL